eukprot:g2494.t1
MLVKTYVATREKSAEKYQETSFQLPRLEKVDWRVDYITDSSDMKGVDAPVVQMRWKMSGESDVSTPVRVDDDERERNENEGSGGIPPSEDKSTLIFEISERKFDAFYGELKVAYQMMEGME